MLTEFEERYGVLTRDDSARRPPAFLGLLLAIAVGGCGAKCPEWTDKKYGYEPHADALRAAMSESKWDEAQRLIVADVARGDPNALWLAGNIALLRDRPADAAMYYERAADKGHLPALAGLAAMYDEGRGVPRDPGRALELYTRVAESEELNATVLTVRSYLATEYARRGGPEDRAMAERWRKLSQAPECDRQDR